MYPSMETLCSTFGSRVDNSRVTQKSTEDVATQMRDLRETITSLRGLVAKGELDPATTLANSERTNALLASSEEVTKFMDKKKLTMSYNTYQLETESGMEEKKLLMYGRTNGPQGWPHSGGALPVYQNESGTWMTTLVGQLRPMAGSKPFLEISCGKTEDEDTDFTERIKAELGEEAGHHWNEGQDIRVLCDTNSAAKDAGLTNAMERMMIDLSEGRKESSLSENEKAQGLGCIEVCVEDLPEVVHAWRSAGGDVAGPLAQLIMGMEFQRWISDQSAQGSEVA